MAKRKSSGNFHPIPAHVLAGPSKFRSQFDPPMTRGTSIDRQRKAKVFERDGFICQYCGHEFSPRSLRSGKKKRALRKKGKPTVDHVTPLSRGGKNGMDNLLTACQNCNVEKGSLTLDEFRALVEGLGSKLWMDRENEE